MVGDVTVENAKIIALALGLSEKLISLTIVAVGTSLPELITCYQATKKGETDLAIGNIAGSQILNIVLILGTASTIRPIYNIIDFKDELEILMIGNLIYLFIPFINERHRMGRLAGLLFVLLYFAYMTINVLEEMNIIA